MSDMVIPLSRGLVAWIDAADSDRVQAHKWCVSGRNPHLYAVTNLPAMNGSRPQIAMHRLIARPASGMVVDHINGDTLDNRRANLRVCAHRKNIASSRSRTGISAFKGVTFDKARNRWVAQIKVDYRRIHLGRYPTEIEAARAYDAAALNAWGDFALLNFTRAEAEAN